MASLATGASSPMAHIRGTQFAIAIHNSDSPKVQLATAFLMMQDSASESF